MLDSGAPPADCQKIMIFATALNHYNDQAGPIETCVGQRPFEG